MSDSLANEWNVRGSGVKVANRRPVFIELSNYAFEPLRKGEEYILYSGWSDGELPAILVVALASEYPALESLERLEHEYSLRDELDSDWAAVPLALTHHLGRTMLVLEDPGGVPLDGLLGRPLELPRFLGWAAAISAALSKLHRRSLIHKDIKPANILVDSASGDVWLTGFGIASRLPRERQTPEPPEVIAGTLAYMAPEQTGRMNRSIDFRSDLYSLGITLYQTLTGVLPFFGADPMEWVHCHIARQPALPEERAKDVPGPISDIIMKLLAKNAEERYQTAVGLETDLRRCLTEWESRERVNPFPLAGHAQGHAGSIRTTSLSGKRRRNRYPEPGPRGIGGRDLRRSLGGASRRTGLAPGWRLRLPPRPRPGSRLCAHPRKGASSATSADWQIIRLTHGNCRNGGEDLRNRQSARSRYRLDRFPGGAKTGS